MQTVALTEAGEAAFLRLRDTAMAFDAKLRADLNADDLDRLDDLLARLMANVTPAADSTPPWAGLAEKGPRIRGKARSS